MPVRADASGTTIDFTVGADGAETVTDTDTLVIFRDGFDVLYGNGTQAAPIIERAAAAAIFDGNALREIAMPDVPSATTVPLLIVRDHAGEVRVDHGSVIGIDLVRLPGL